MVDRVLIGWQVWHDRGAGGHVLSVLHVYEHDFGI